MIIKALQTKDKCQEIAQRTGEKCQHTAKAVVIHRELSSETRKKLCGAHAYDVLMRHCHDLQEENKQLQKDLVRAKVKFWE